MPNLETFHLSVLIPDAFVVLTEPLLVSKASAINSTPPVDEIEIGRYLPFLPVGNNLNEVMFESLLFAWKHGPSIYEVALPPL